MSAASTGALADPSASPPPSVSPEWGDSARCFECESFRIRRERLVETYSASPSAPRKGMASALPISPTVLVAIAVALVIPLGIAIGVAQVVLARRRTAALGEWARGAYALWTGGEDSATWNRERAVSSLDAWYGAKSTASFWMVIEELRAGQTNSRAWDLVRALDLLRIGLAAGYVDADTFATSAGAMARDLRASHSGWENLATAFEGGMNDWQTRRGVSSPAELGRVQRNLPALRGQIWPRIQWGVALPESD